MKKRYVLPAALGVLSFAAAAQNDQQGIALEKLAAQVKVISLQGGIMGKTIKGAPYSAIEVSETTQMLADGTRIHNESQTQVYRDSEGRMRRETPNEITIWDPVANASYLLNPKTQTARKMSMGNFVYNTTRVVNGEVSTFTMRSGTSEARVPAPADEAKIKAELEAMARLKVTTANLDGMKRTVVRREKLKEEPLGKQVIEGVSSEGTRTVSTIETGAIGNDRPIQNVTERWFSPELQTVMLTRSTDPRAGEELFKLINVSRAEPASYLFQVPAGYQLIEGPPPPPPAPK